MKCRHFGYHHNRNCRKFGDLKARWDDKRPTFWAPSYETADGKTVEIQELATAECPVSLITPESQEFLEKFWRMQSVRKATGVVSGPSADPGEWPARLVDALIAIQEERDAAEAIKQRVSRRG